MDFRRFFSAPPFTCPRRHASLIAATLLFGHRTSPSPETSGSAVSAWLCDLTDPDYRRMLVRVPVHGMQGPLEKQMPSLYTNPACPRSGPRKLLGLPPWPKEASRRANAHCLRPQAEFTRASGPGLRRVNNFVEDVKGICKRKQIHGMQGIQKAMVL
jgi:hypothetical protein